MVYDTLRLLYNSGIPPMVWFFYFKPCNDLSLPNLSFSSPAQILSTTAFMDWMGPRLNCTGTNLKILWAVLRWQDQSPKLAVADFTSCCPAGYLVSLERCGASIGPVSWFVVQEILPPRIGQWCTGCHNYRMLLPTVGRGWPVGYFAGRGEPSAWSKTHRHDWRAHQYHRR